MVSVVGGGCFSGVRKKARDGVVRQTSKRLPKYGFLEAR